jgi:hypothetical protein
VTYEEFKRACKALEDQRKAGNVPVHVTVYSPAENVPVAITAYMGTSGTIVLLPDGTWKWA